jgi:CheY-like chemotaxis protein
MDLLDGLGRARRVPTEGEVGAIGVRDVDAMCVISERQPGSATPSLLIVEDEIILRMATADEFREGGFFVNEAANGDEAVAMLRSYSNIDAVFSDVRMPGTLDGIGLAEWVRRHYPKIRMFLTSGTLEAFPTNQTVADGYFPKPYVTAEVERAIKQVCEKDYPTR